MSDEASSRRRTIVVIGLGLATIAGITGLQLVDDAPSRVTRERTTTTTTRGGSSHG